MLYDVNTKKTHLVHNSSPNFELYEWDQPSGDIEVTFDTKNAHYNCGIIHNNEMHDPSSLEKSYPYNNVKYVSILFVEFPNPYAKIDS